MKLYLNGGYSYKYDQCWAYLTIFLVLNSRLITISYWFQLIFISTNKVKVDNYFI